MLGFQQFVCTPRFGAAQKLQSFSQAVVMALDAGGGLQKITQHGGFHNPLLTIQKKRNENTG